MDVADWDARYASRELVWGAGPNEFVAAELADLPPGTALDVACGEGRNALWLAGRGWRVVGVDFSTIGLQRAKRLAADAELTGQVEFLRADAVRALPEGPFDVVVVAYLQLPAEQRRRAFRLAADRVAPGGTLLVVGHDSSNLREGHGGPQDSSVLYGPKDVVADLRGLPGLRVERSEPVQRQVTTDDGERTAIDVLVRARREERT